jgi:hypothetical protein
LNPDHPLVQDAIPGFDGYNFGFDDVEGEFDPEYAPVAFGEYQDEEDDEDEEDFEDEDNRGNVVANEQPHFVR